jgi:hypothetical protein
MHQGQDPGHTHARGWESDRAGAIGMGIEASLTTRSARLRLRLSSDVVLVKYRGGSSMSTDGMIDTPLHAGYKVQ